MKSGSWLPEWLTGSVLLSWHLCSLLARSGSSWWRISTSLPPRLSPGTPRCICPRLTSWGEAGKMPRLTFQAKSCDLTVPESELSTENQAQRWQGRYSWVYFLLVMGSCGPSPKQKCRFQVIHSTAVWWWRMKVSIMTNFEVEHVFFLLKKTKKTVTVDIPLFHEMSLLLQ